MQKETLNKFKHELEKDREHIMDNINHIDDGGLGVSLSESVEELSVYDQHPADIGSEIFERSKDFSLREDAMLKVRAIDHALQRMQNGKYGICEVCGKEIPIDRLKAVPYTTQCIDCRADAEEASYRQNVRPVEEDVLEPPFSRTSNDATDVNEYDGEDAWQDVAKWQEHAPHSAAGSYYGGDEEDEEPIGYTELVDHIPYEVGDDGNFYEDTRGTDDESTPAEKIDIGFDHGDDQTDDNA